MSKATAFASVVDRVQFDLHYTARRDQARDEQRRVGGIDTVEYLSMRFDRLPPLPVGVRKSRVRTTRSRVAPSSPAAAKASSSATLV
jgi:hypothetical protein